MRAFQELFMTETLLVTGASGHLGRAVVRHLLDSRNIPASRIIATSRDTSKLADLAARGVATRKADFNDPASLPAAFAGADRVLIISTDTDPGAGTRLTQHQAAIAAAKAAGAKKVLYTSLPEAEASSISFAFEHLGTEKAIKESGLPYTIFRNSWYFENLFRSLPHALQTGQWFTSAGDGRVSYAARDDYAAAIAAGLASDDTGSRTVTLTGPTAYSASEVAALASEIVGKPIAVVQVSDEQLAGGLKQAGLPDPVVQLVVSIDKTTRNGHLGTVTNAVEALSGRPPKTLRAFLEANKAALAT
jgi:NAD(P)H dehydrogenase (quinone)